MVEGGREGGWRGERDGWRDGRSGGGSEGTSERGMEGGSDEGREREWLSERERCHGSDKRTSGLPTVCNPHRIAQERCSTPPQIASQHACR